ncbi:MAG: cytochrome c [Bacteroidota bacterium]
MRNLILTIIVCAIPVILMAQNEWIIPEADLQKISPYIFEDDVVNSGEIIYENSCISCHGTPTKNNPMVFVPSPGDPASEKFQNQTDGSIYYKISNGRGGMPAFAETFAEEEIWGLIGYFRSFNENYEQPEFDYGDEVLAELALGLSYDENVDKLVVKVTSNGEHKEGIEVSSWVVGLFGKFPLGVESTNNSGIAYFSVDPTLPGDEEGNITVQVRAQQGYSIEKINQKMKLVNPTEKTSLIEGRHLWSPALKAPWWLIIVYNLVVVGIWSIIIYIVIGLFRLKKVS